MRGFGVIFLTLLQSASSFALKISNLHPKPGHALARSHGGLGGTRPRSQRERRKSKEVHKHVHRSVSRSYGRHVFRRNGDAPSVLKSGFQRLDVDVGLNFMVVVPEDASHNPLDGPFPVILLFHQHDPGRGSERMAELSDGFRQMMPRAADSHILVTPSGFGGSWSTCGGASPRDDLTLIGSNLLGFLSTFRNVQQTFKLFGFSQGAAFVNRLLIENYDPRITDVVTCNNQLTKPQFRAGRFYLGGDDNDYQFPSENELLPRRILQITGDADVMMPAYGGPGEVELPTLSWEESIYRFAQAYGWVDAAISFTSEDRFENVSYFDGKLRAFNYFGLPHDLGKCFEVEWIQPFFTDGENYPSFSAFGHGSPRKIRKKDSRFGLHGSPRAMRKKASSSRRGSTRTRRKKSSSRVARHGPTQTTHEKNSRFRNQGFSRSIKKKGSSSKTLVGHGPAWTKRKKHSSSRTAGHGSGRQKRKSVESKSSTKSSHRN